MNGGTREASLGVFLNRTYAGSLTRSGGGKIVFDRSMELPSAVPVALAWEEGESRVENTGLHPVFAQSLPEGYLKERILERIGGALRSSGDELTLARMVGRSLIGRIRLAPSIEDLVPFGDYDYRSEIMEGRRSREDLIGELVDRFASNAGVSGVHPKIQIESGNLDRFAVPGPTHILKTYDPDEYPALTANEFFCMDLARRAGIVAAEAEISEDGLWLAVKRFDRDPEGRYLGFEDMCALPEIPASWKYHGDYENIAESISHHAENPRTDLKRLFAQVAFSCFIGNGDAHRKNFGVLYSGREDVRLAPAYDLVCTEAYIEEDKMALEMGGSKEWPDARTLTTFGTASCWMKRSEVTDAIERICQTMQDGRKELAAGNIPGLAAGVGQCMDRRISKGLRMYGRGG